MKKYQLIILFLTLTGTLSAEPLQGIVTASSLMCRSEPKRTGKAIQSFYFGDVLALVEKTSEPDTVDELQARWYKPQGRDCWLFGGYLYVDASFNNRYRTDLVECNTGTEWDGGFEPLFSDNYYVATDSWPPFAMPLKIAGKEHVGSKGEFTPLIVVTVGLVARSKDTITFTPVRIAAYEGGTFVGFLSKVDHPYLFKETVHHRFRDALGEFFNGSFEDRAPLITYCKAHQNDYFAPGPQIFYRWHTLHQTAPLLPFFPRLCKEDLAHGCLP